MVLALLLLMGCAISALGDIDTLQYEPTLTNAMDYSASTWFSTSSNRAMLSLLLTLDLVTKYDSQSQYVPDLSKPSFVGKSDEDLFLTAHTQTGAQIIISYRPSTGVGFYGLHESASDSNVEYALSQICPDGCYKNDSSDIQAAVQLVQSVLDNN